MQKISFYYLDRNPGIKNRTRLKEFIAQLFSNERKNLGNLSYIFCSDKHLLKINQDFLHHNFYTDVITFDLGSAGSPVEGEIYISIDRIKDNARTMKLSFAEELHRVMFHGALHLCGYKDKSKRDELLMRQTEDKYLNLYF